MTSVWLNLNPIEAKIEKNMVFESVKKERTAKAWSYFLLEKSTEKAQCILCKKILKATGSSTKSLNDHLKLKHANEWIS